MRVLIATDGTEASDEAVRLAGLLLKEDFEAVVVNVVPELPVAGDDAGGIEGPTLDPETAAELRAELLEERQETVDGAVRILRRSGHPDEAETHIEAGHPGRAICTLADAEDVDLIVVGTHERGLLSRLVNGSVSRWVLEHSTRPVLLARGHVEPTP